MSAAILVVGILLGVGILTDQLLRLRRWLQKVPPPPPVPEVQEPPDDNA